jgi:hypothetical protein
MKRHAQGHLHPKLEAQEARTDMSRPGIEPTLRGGRQAL